MYCKNCKKHVGDTFPKKLALISKNKIKGKSKCGICFDWKDFYSWNWGQIWSRE